MYNATLIRTRGNGFEFRGRSGSIRLPPCTHAQPACAWHAAAASCMHGGAAPRAELYRTLSSCKRPREAPLCVCACPSRGRTIRDSIPKGSAPCFEQLECALLTGHLAPDPPKQQMIQIHTRSAKPDLVLDDWSVVQMDRVDVLC